MARIRSVRPDFWSRNSLASLDTLTRFVMLGLLTNADDKGRLPGEPKFILATLFPFGGATVGKVDAALTALATAEPPEIVRYSVGRSRFIELVGFLAEDHWQGQCIKKPQPSRLPSPPVTNQYPTGAEPIPPGVEGKGKEGSGEDERGLGREGTRGSAAVGEPTSPRSGQEMFRDACAKIGITP